MKDTQPLSLIAYQVSNLPMRLELAPASRQWMEETHEHFAKRCLPMLMANYGWWIVTTVPFRATWNGMPDLSGIQIEPLQAGASVPCISHFGHGLLTFSMNWIVRTPPGYNLLVRGPANLPKDGIAPLEGLVEADSETIATFTMNWKFTRACTVTFAKDEPFCMLVPHARGDLEEWKISCLPIDADLQTKARYQEWSVSRLRFNGALAQHEPEACQQKWQKDYFQSAQQTKRRLAPVE